MGEKPSMEFEPQCRSFKKDIGIESTSGWFSLVSLFKGISTFMGFLMPKLSL